MVNFHPINQEQRRYTMTHRALALLDSGVDDNPAPAIPIGTLVSIDHVKAANFQYNTRKALMKQGLATGNEVLEAEMRKTSIGIETWCSLTLPYGEALILQELANIKTIFRTILGRLDAIDGRTTGSMQGTMDGIQNTLSGILIQIANIATQTANIVTPTSSVDETFTLVDSNM